MRPVCLALLLPLAACGQGGADRLPGTPVDAAGAGPSRTFAVSGFTAVELTSVDDVDVRVGPAFSVRAEGDPATLDRLRLTRDGDTLHVGRASGWSMGDRGAKVFVTLPSLVQAAVSGTGDLAVDRVTGQGFAADMSGTGAIRVGQADVGKVAVSLSGTGDVTIAGRARVLTAQVSGTGDLDARGLAAASAEVDSSGTGDLRANVTGPAKVSASGTGDVDLGPHAHCDTQRSGTGDVRCGG